MRRVLLLTIAMVLAAPLIVSADDPPQDTPNAAKAREKLKKTIKVDWKDTRLDEIVDDLKEQTGVSFHLDPNGVSKNAKFTLKSKDKSAEEVLNTLLGERKWGWYI